MDTGYDDGVNSIIPEKPLQTGIVECGIMMLIDYDVRDGSQFIDDIRFIALDLISPPSVHQVAPVLILEMPGSDNRTPEGGGEFFYYIDYGWGCRDESMAFIA